MKAEARASSLVDRDRYVFKEPTVLLTIAPTAGEAAMEKGILWQQYLFYAWFKLRKV